MAADLLAVEEERLQEAVDALPPDARRQYFDLANEAFKDPDLYATLAYVFISGLHHFYLGRWGRGLMDLGLNVLGIGLVVTGAVMGNFVIAAVGAVLVIGVAVVELKHLFQSQTIVRQYNLDRQREILASISGPRSSR